MKNLVTVFALLLCCAFQTPASAQALTVRLTHTSNIPRGDLLVTRAGRETLVARDVWKFWLFDDGQTLLWAGSDGGGGFENEGQSLWRFDAATGKKRKIVAEVFAIDTVREARATSGKRAFVLSMSDGGLGASHIAVVRENGGTVWRHTLARVAAIRNGRVAIALLQADANSDSPPTRVRRIVYRSIDALLS